MPRVFKDPAATATADHVRWIAAIWGDRDGFVSRCRHGDRVIVVGHARYHTDPVIADQIDTLLAALRHPGTINPSGYAIKGLHELDDTAPAGDGQLSLVD
jgi:hypothetical protein